LDTEKYPDSLKEKDTIFSYRDMASFKKADQGIYRLSSEFNHLSIGVITKSTCNIDYTNDFNTIRREEKKLVESITGIDIKNIIFLNQVHGDKILTINSIPDENLPFAGDADGLITGLAGICLIIRTADCVPIFVYDHKNNLLGAAHSGWKGSKLSIAKKLIKQMQSVNGSDYKNMHVYILPSISPDSYTVNPDVAQFFQNYFIEKDNKIYLNMWKNIERSLMEEGIPESNIFNSKICNYINSIEFFSYRSGDEGRNLNFAYMKAV